MRVSQFCKVNVYYAQMTPFKKKGRVDHDKSMSCVKRINHSLESNTVLNKDAVTEIRKGNLKSPGSPPPPLACKISQ